MAVLDEALERAKAVQRDRLSGQMSLFSLTEDQEGLAHTEIPLPDIPEWPENERLAREKELVGYYISGHPLEKSKNYP